MRAACLTQEDRYRLRPLSLKIELKLVSLAKARQPANASMTHAHSAANLRHGEMYRKGNTA